MAGGRGALQRAVCQVGRTNSGQLGVVVVVAAAGCARARARGHTPLNTNCVVATQRTPQRAMAHLPSESRPCITVSPPAPGSVNLRHVAATKSARA